LLNDAPQHDQEIFLAQCMIGGQLLTSGDGSMDPAYEVSTINGRWAMVEMNNPGVWVMGEVRKHIMSGGMGTAVEYAGCTGMMLLHYA
jgi:hypothetical protein